MACDDRLPDYPAGNIIGAWYRLALERLREPPHLPSPSHHPLVVRLVVLPTWGLACCVRGEPNGTGWHLLAKQLSGEDAGSELGELGGRWECRVGGADADRLDTLWRYLRFWDIATTGGQDDVLDGTSYFLEAAERGRQRVVRRDDPEWGDTFGEFADLLVRLAGLAAR